MNVYASRLKVVASHLGMKRITRFVSIQQKRLFPPSSITHMNPFALHIFKVNTLVFVGSLVCLFLLRRSTPTKTHQYSQLLSSRFLPLQSPCEDCSVGVMFWVHLLFSLYGFRPIAQQNVLLRNPEFRQTKLLALLGNPTATTTSLRFVLSTEAQQKANEHVHNDSIRMN